MNGFLEFVRKQGVIGFATGFILGQGVSNLVGAFVTDFVNPLLGVILKRVDNLNSATFHLFGAVFSWGHFVSTLINFLILALVVYFLFKVLRLEKLDICEEKK